MPNLRIKNGIKVNNYFIKYIGGIFMNNQLLENLNKFLADLAVFYRKLQNYHWNVVGKQFFVAHEKLEEYYDEINKDIDEIGEHILILGGQPLGSLKDYLEKTTLAEAKNEKISACDIYNNIKADYQILYNTAHKIKEQSDAEKDYATSSLMDDYMRKYGKILWMLSAQSED